LQTGLCIAGLYAIYQMMYMFLTPLLWATLVGTILFPIKRRISSALNVFCFLQFFSFAKVLFFNFFDRKEGLITLAIFILLKILNYGILLYFISVIANIYNTIDNFILFMNRKWVLPLAIVYLAAYMGWIYLFDEKSVNKKVARVISVPLWIFALSFISVFFGPLRVLIFIALASVLGLIACGIISADEDEEKRKIFFFKSWINLYFIGLAIMSQTGIADFISSSKDAIYAYIKRIVHVTVASPLRKFFKLIFTSDKMFRNSIQIFLDDISTMIVIGLLAFGSLFLIIFVIFQLHNEAILLTKLGSNVFAQQPDWLNFAMNYTGDQFQPNDLDSYVEQGYQKGREWIVSNIRSLVDPKDTERADKLEMEVIEVLDNFYRMWEERSTKNIYEKSSDQWISQLTSVTNLSALKEEIIKIIQENVQTILHILQSMWSLILMNISLIGSFFFSTIGVVIVFGLGILNFFIKIIVFLTALYYLLSSSYDEWLPLKWISNSNDQSDSKSMNISEAIESAISGVFVLSLKMATFYGLYTYFVHTIFGLHIIFVPSMLAAIFAAIPIVAPHFVCIIGAIELYIVRGEIAAAFLFVLASFAPKIFADFAFYCELRGSHPYVTGLAIIGGIYWLGLQGAIIGPILLCSMLVLMDVYLHFISLKL
uniref:Transmembrane protein 245 n=1 Tax=Dracunculus medinensis TaxID=318479 RepID=A0A0N4UKC3_DRAME